jgi:hypothetical protein
MRQIVWMLAGLAALATLPAMAADKDGPNSSSDQIQWARWQGRLSLGTPAAAWRLGVEAAAQKYNSASLMGDYYFSSALAGANQVGGFRATSGLIMGPRGTLGSLGAGQPSVAGGNAFTIANRAFGPSALPYANDLATETATAPYLGVGYTNLSLRSHWGFSADLGLIGQGATNGVRLGRTFSGGAGLDDAVRDLRMAPMLQLGAYYSF